MTKLSALTCPTTNNDDDEHAEEPNSTSWERDMYCQPRAVLYAFGRSVGRGNEFQPRVDNEEVRLETYEEKNSTHLPL